MNKDQIKDLLNSDNFCSHLELSATIYPGSRWVPCCKSNGESLVSMPLQKGTLQDYKSSSGFQKIKNDLDSRIKNQFCKVCKDIENSGGKSDRQFNNENWLRIINENNLWDEFDNFYKSNLENQYGAWHWYLFVDNQCQARCVMCDPVFSTALKKEYQSIGWNTIEFAKDRSQDLTINDPKKVIDEFKKQAHEAKILQLLGGEPTLSQDSLDLLQWLVDKNLASNIILKINTNGINIPKSWIEVCRHFKTCQWSVSIDAVGDLNYWIRYPTPWSYVERNIKTLLDAGYFVMIKSTVHALNAHYLPELYDWAREKNLLFTATMVYSPSEISVHALNQHQRNALSDKYQANNKFYIAHGEKILNYVDSIPVSDQSLLKNFLEKLQPHRPIQFKDVNPYFS